MQKARSSAISGERTGLRTICRNYSLGQGRVASRAGFALAYPVRMFSERPRFDLFACALGALCLLALGFLVARNGPAVVMCALCLGGLIAARLVGFSNRALVPLALGLVALLWFVWSASAEDARRTTTFAHFVGGGLAGWAIAEFLRAHIRGAALALAATTAVIAIAVIWEIGEIGADRVFDTALIPSKRDSAYDVFFGAAGGAVGVAVAMLIAAPARRPVA